MTLVEFYIVLPTGDPLVDSTIEIQLSKSTFTDDVDGIAMPRPITVTTDSVGKVTLGLWPSTAMYYAQVMDPASEAGIYYKFIVPNVPPGTVVRVQDLIVDAPMSGTTYDEEALAVIHDAKINAKISEQAAAASAVQAGTYVATVAASAQSALTAAAAAALSEFNAAAKAAEALASQIAAESAEGVAVFAAGAAEISKDAAAVSATAAAGSQASAATSATTATTKAGEASTSATAAAASASQAAADAVGVGAFATAAAASATAAAASETAAEGYADDAAVSATAAEAAAATAVAIAGSDFITSFNGRGPGAVTLLEADVESALGFEPYNATNPNGFVTAAANVASATKLQTARNINGVAFDGTANITVADDTKLPLAGGTLTGALDATGLSVDGDAVWHEGNFDPDDVTTFPPTPVEITADTTAVVNTLYHLNSSGGSFELTLPVAPAENSWLWVVDAKGSCGTNPVTVYHNGKKVDDVLDDILMDVSFDSIFWVFKSNQWVTQ